MILENRFEHIEELIAKVLTGEATGDELSLVEEWRAASEANEKEFTLMQKLFAESATLKNSIPVDTDKAWLRVKAGMQKSPPRIIPFYRSVAARSFYRVAAMVVLVAGLGISVYFMLNKSSRFDVFVATTNEVKQDTLPDGSTCTLNRNSTIAYSSSGFEKKRKLQLKGEAFFEVKHDEKNSFVVEANGLIIQDIGTSFNVKAYAGSKIVIVTVATGEVKIFTAEREGLNLVAGEEAIYDTGTGSFTRTEHPDRNISAYKDKVFIFENTELHVIIKLLNDVYQSNIIIGNEELKSCRITTTFNNEPLDTILDVIAETLQLKVSKSQTEIKIDGNGCR